jgi:hypothetical protein
VIAPFFHVGIVVPEFAEARREFSSTLGLTWRPEARVSMRVRANGREAVDHDFAIVYSIEGPPHVELMAPWDSPWDLRGGIHHLGMYTEDLAGDLAALAQQNYRELASGVGANGELESFAFMESPTGIILELIDTRLRGVSREVASS